MSNAESVNTEQIQLPCTAIPITPDGVARVTPEVAKELLRICPNERNRNVAPNTVQRYVDLMKGGKWGLSAGWIGWVDGRPAILDMQHRLHAVIQSGVPVEIAILKIEFDSLDARDDFCANLDRGKGRTAGDFVHIHGYKEFPYLEQGEVNRLCSAVPYLLTGFQNNTPTSSRPGAQDSRLRVDLAKPYGKIGQKYFEAVRKAVGPLRTSLFRGPVIAVGLALIEHQENKAVDFFQRIALNENMKRDTGEWWLTTTVFVDRDLYGAKDNVRLTRAMAKAWNAYAQGRTLPKFNLTTQEADSPIELAGTPYKRKEVYIPESLLEIRAGWGTPPGPSKRAKTRTRNHLQNGHEPEE